MLVLIAKPQESPMPHPDGKMKVSLLESKEARKSPLLRFIRMDHRVSILNLVCLTQWLSQLKLRMTKMSDVLAMVKIWE